MNLDLLIDVFPQWLIFNIKEPVNCITFAEKMITAQAFQGAKHVLVPFTKINPENDIWDNDGWNSHSVKHQACHPQRWPKLFSLEVDKPGVNILLVANLFARSDKEWDAS